MKGKCKHPVIDVHYKMEGSSCFNRKDVKNGKVILDSGDFSIDEKEITSLECRICGEVITGIEVLEYESEEE